MIARIYIFFVAALTLAAVFVAGKLGFSIESLINTVLYGLLSLLAVLVLRRERLFRSVFYQMWFLFTGFTLIISLQIFSVLFLSPYLQSDIYVYSTMLLPFFVCWTVVYVLMEYIFADWSPPKRMLLTLAIVLPVWLAAFYPYYIDPRALALAPQASNPLLYYQPLYIHAAYVNFLSLAAVGTFFMIKLRSDKATAVYVDTLMFWFSLFVIFEILYNLANATNFSLFTISQYAGMGTLLLIAGTLIMRLRFQSHTGMFYESQILSVDPLVGRRAGFFDRFIRRNFFNSKTIAKRIFLETPRGKISLRNPRAGCNKADTLGTFSRGKQIKNTTLTSHLTHAQRGSENGEK